MIFSLPFLTMGAAQVTQACGDLCSSLVRSWYCVCAVSSSGDDMPGLVPAGLSYKGKQGKGQGRCAREGHAPLCSWMLSELSGWGLKLGSVGAAPRWVESEARGWPLVFTFTGVEVMSSSPTRNFHTNFFLFFSLPQEKKKGLCCVFQSL